MPHAAIRPFLREDLDRVRVLVDESGMFPSDLLDDMCAPFFSGDPAQRWLVFDDGRVDAACYCVPEEMTDGVWNLLFIAVARARRGEGLGKALMHHVEEQLTAQGARMLLVDTSGTDAFDHTRAFYAMLDYEQEARIRDYWAQGDDKITFRKVLPPS